MANTLRVLLAGAVAIAVVGVAAFAAPGPAPVAGVASADGGADPADPLAPYLTQQLAWGPCASFASTSDEQQAFADPKFDCAYLEAPLDYAHPDGKRVQIAMLRQKASDPAARIGSLFTDPGGPGGSGVAYLPTFAAGVEGTDIAKRFDLIGFDPRGVGVSKPTIDCSNPAEIDAERADLDVDSSPAGVAQTESEEKTFAQRCVDRVGLDVLANVGTRDVARDLNLMSTVVGDQKLTYVGYSYGTSIGEEYAEQFPTQVRALVLDGVIDPALGPVESRVTQARGFQRAFDNFAKACVAEPQCPLGADAAGANTVMQQLLRGLITKPVPAGAGRTLGYNDALTGVLTAMYSESLWPFLSQGLAQLKAGDGTNLMRLADAYYERNPDGSYSNLLEAFQVINCADTVPVTDRAVAREISEEGLQLAPFADPGTGPSDALEQCAFWPVPATSKPGPVEAPGLPTVLVVSSTGDPATPYEDGVSVAKQMNARLLSVQNDSHTAALQGVNACADKIVTDYLVNLTLPAADARC